MLQSDYEFVPDRLSRERVNSATGAADNRGPEDGPAGGGSSDRDLMMMMTLTVTLATSEAEV
jgi:hypothetical protein